MRTAPDVLRPNVEAWQAELLRLTAFVHEDFDPFTIDWWGRLLDSEPETTQEDRRGRSKQQTAAYEGGQLTLVTSPGLANWLFTTTDIDRREPTQFNQNIDIFHNLVRRWLEFAPGLVRVAFGAVLRLPVDSRESGYIQMSSYMNFDLNPNESFDFNYQINRPRNVSVDGLPVRINRLSRWSVAGVYSVAIQPGVMASVPRWKSSYCRLELDVNTAADQTDQLPQPVLPRLFSELIEQGLQVIRQGDIP